jgi:hypothetical protein
LRVARQEFVSIWSRTVFKVMEYHACMKTKSVRALCVDVSQLAGCCRCPCRCPCRCRCGVDVSVGVDALNALPLSQIAATTLAACPALVSSSTISLLHIINSTEHVGPVVADVLAKLSSEHSDTALLKELLRELGVVSGTESKDSAGVRHIATFLVRLVYSSSPSSPSSPSPTSL